MTQLPLDIPSALPLYSKNSSFKLHWPIRYNDYESFTYGLIDSCVYATKFLQDDLLIVYKSKISEIINDICCVFAIEYEISSAKADGLLPLANPTSSPMRALRLKHYQNNSFPKVKSYSEKTEPFIYSAKEIGKQIFYSFGNAIKKNENIYNVFNENILLDEALKEKGQSSSNLLLSHWFSEKKIIKTSCPEIISEILANYFEKSDFLDKSSIRMFVNTCREIVANHLTDAMTDLNSLKNSQLKKYLRKGLMSGTPKSRGRLLGWYFMDNGKEVIRFAHGGERVFFKDYNWALSELVFCNKYFAHSGAEARKIKSRLTNKCYAQFDDMGNINLQSLGSKKHIKLSKMHRQNTNEKKELVYVPNLYTGEELHHLPTFKVPDTLYFDWQVRLLRFLRAEGWLINLKPHPKGAYNQKLILGPYVDNTIDGTFDITNINSQTILYDFAGTAFFDGLASTKEICLINLGCRPFDLEERKFLEKRCKILQAGFDNNGTLKLDQNAIRNILHARTNPNACHDFKQRYFYS